MRGLGLRKDRKLANDAVILQQTRVTVRTKVASAQARYACAAVTIAPQRVQHLFATCSIASFPVPTS